jgi:nucleotide-binding universal stress UspA family protein
MYKHILIATDGSELALKAVETGLALAKALNAKVSAVTVTEPWVDFAAPEAVIAFPPEEYQKAAAANASKILSAVTKAAERAGVTCETVHVADRFSRTARCRSSSAGKNRTRHSQPVEAAQHHH